MSRGTDALETINAAATAIASTENPVPQATKRRWGSCWGDYWCFGTYKTKRIGHAILLSESSTTDTNILEAERPLQSPSMTVPFIAPPSSPVSFIPSEPASAAHSPTGILSLSVYANMYSPGGPTSIFATGPYAHETQLVSPPVFSSFTTEPSTAPYTPPPESVHMTTPSSPEVPFARLLEPDLQNGEKCSLSQYEFQSYQFQPGSPVSHLISPSSGISGSGTSSPFLDREFASGVHPFFLEFRTGNGPKLLDLDKIVRREFRGSFQDSGNDEAVTERRVSFEMNDEVVRCVERESTSASPKPVLEPVENIERVTQEKRIDEAHADECPDGETLGSNTHETEPQNQKSRTATLGSAKEFIFDNIDGVTCDRETRIGSSDWWANEKISAGGN